MTLRIGADADPWQFYRGVLDNVRIYNRSLAASEIASDMATEVGAGATLGSPITLLATAPAP